MDNVFAVAKLKRGADIDAELRRFLLRQFTFGKAFCERSQKLHADVDIPSEAVLLFNDLVILNADDVRSAFE